MTAPMVDLPLAAAAHAYAGRGWAVLPVHHLVGDACSCRRGAACQSKAKHPVFPKWGEKATTSGADVAEIWQAHPDANPGIATGSRSGFWVLDVDDLGAWLSLLDGRPEPETYTVRTGSGGRHFYFTLPDFEIPTNKGKPVAGLDLRGEGGMVVAPPSVSAKGRYEVLHDLPVRPAPDYLLDLVREASRKPAPAVVEVVAGTDTPTVRGDAYARSAVANVLAQLDGLPRPWRKGAGWDSGTFNVACTLVEFANAGWNSYTLADARRDLFAHAPRDEAWGADQHKAKFDSAVQTVGGAGRVLPAPTVHEGDPFAGLLPAATRSPGVSVQVGAPTAPPATSALKVTRLSDVVPEAVSWLWPGRIPAGKLVTLDGDPGLGKSTLAMAFAGPVTTGGSWPDGSRCDFPGDVVLLAAEDGLADTIRPRLDAAGADVTRVHAVEGVSSVDPDTGESYLRPPTLADVDALLELVVRVGARLLVVDVLMAYLPAGTDSHKDQDIRRVLSRLGTLADATGCTVLLLRHLNKAKGGDPMYRGGGSIGIVGAARAGMLVARDPDDDDLRVLASTKSNLGPAPDALTYRLVDGHTFGVARVKWEGTSTHDARALLADHAEDAAERPERDEAVAWLEDHLTEQGRVLSRDVKAAAQKERITERTLKRAAKELGVVYAEEGFPRRTFWCLPGQVPSGDTVPDPDPRLSERGPTVPTGPTASDLRELDASQDAEPQSGQWGHGSERRPHCTVCGQLLLLDVPGRTVCDARDDVHATARAGCAA